MLMEMERWTEHANKPKIETKVKTMGRREVVIV